MLKIKEKVKIFCKRSKQAVLSSVTALAIAYATAATPVYASSYLDPINKLKTVFISIVAAAGNCLGIWWIEVCGSISEKGSEW